MKILYVPPDRHLNFQNFIIMPPIRHVHNGSSQTTDIWNLPGATLTKHRNHPIPFQPLYGFVRECGLYPRYVDLKDVNRIIRKSGRPLVEKHIIREMYRFSHWLHVLDGKLDVPDKVKRTLAKGVHRELLEVLVDLTADLKEISASSFTMMFFCLVDLAEQVDESEISEFLPGINQLRWPWTESNAEKFGSDKMVLAVLAQAMFDVIGVWSEGQQVIAMPELEKRIMELSEKYPNAEFEDVLDWFPEPED
jgi:hypothetical protein